MKDIKGVEKGEMTYREKSLLKFIVDAMEIFIEKHGYIERHEMLCVYSQLAVILFTKQTPIKDINAQCEEIDSFCQYLKVCAREDFE